VSAPPVAPSDSEPPPSTASDVPRSDIFVGRLIASEGAWALQDLYNATAREGYDNQPRFVADGSSILYTSVRDGQSDIYRYDLQANTHTRVTETEANEYSPTPMDDGMSISVIRELGGVQHLWRYGLDGSDQGRLFEALDRIGYHLWLGPEWAAFFLVADGEAEAHQLVHAKSPGDAPELIFEGPGRCFAMIPGQSAFSFLMPKAVGERDEAQLVRYELESGTISSLARPLPESEDYAWTPDGALLMGSGTELMRWTKGEGWRPVELVARKGSALPAHSISRIAVSPDGGSVALVDVGPPGIR
jgi:hypothetical protein